MDTPPAISLVISDPTAGATILADRVTVRGTIAGPANVGVSVNGVTAVVSGDVFAAADVPLTTGQNIATATAAVPAGDVVATSIVVSSDGGPPTVELQASPTTGLAPLTVNFSYSLRTTERVQNLTVDFNGDGSPDLTTTDPTATLQMTYTLPGLYTAHLTVTTDAGNSFQATVPIAVQDEALVVGILKDLSTSLTGQLAAGNANGALALFDDFGQSKFAGVFSDLGISLPLALASFSPLEVRQVGQDVAEGWVIDGSSGDQKLFFVYFLRGADGVWRIHSL